MGAANGVNPPFVWSMGDVSVGHGPKWAYAGFRLNGRVFWEWVFCLDLLHSLSKFIAFLNARETDSYCHVSIQVVKLHFRVDIL